MSAQIIDGKAIAAGLRQEIAAEVERWQQAGHRLPGLTVILVGNDPASEVYVRGKRRDCDEVGFQSNVQHLSANVTQEDLEHRIKALNEDPTVDGILVQTPLPEHINEVRIIDCIDPSKDVDGFPRLQHWLARPAPACFSQLHAERCHAAARAPGSRV